MAKIALSKMSVKELKDLQFQTEQAISEKEEAEKAELKEKMAAMAKVAGYSVEELFGKAKGKRAAAAPKYRNPDNPSQTWSGRGRKPKWLSELLEAGKDLEDLAI